MLARASVRPARLREAPRGKTGTGPRRGPAPTRGLDARLWQDGRGTAPVPCTPGQGRGGSLGPETPQDAEDRSASGEPGGAGERRRRSEGRGGREGWLDESGLTPLSGSSFGPSRSASSLSPASPDSSSCAAGPAIAGETGEAETRSEWIGEGSDDSDQAGTRTRAGRGTRTRAGRGGEWGVGRGGSGRDRAGWAGPGQGGAGRAQQDGGRDGGEVEEEGGGWRGVAGTAVVRRVRAWDGGGGGGGAGLGAAGSGLVCGGRDGRIRVWAWVDGLDGENGCERGDRSGWGGGGGRGLERDRWQDRGDGGGEGEGVTVEADGGMLPPLSPGEEGALGDEGDEGGDGWCSSVGAGGGTGEFGGVGGWMSGPADSERETSGVVPTSTPVRAAGTSATGAATGGTQQAEAEVAAGGGDGRARGAGTDVPGDMGAAGGGCDSWELSPGPGRARPGFRGRWVCAHVVEPGGRPEGGGEGGACEYLGDAARGPRPGHRRDGRPPRGAQEGGPASGAPAAAAAWSGGEGVPAEDGGSGAAGRAGRAGRAGVVCMGVGRSGCGGYLLGCGLDDGSVRAGPFVLRAGPFVYLTKFEHDDGSVRACIGSYNDHQVVSVFTRRRLGTRRARPRARNRL